eukprot:SAG11_NODE_31474_length_291_cov_1.286458_1_plen_78_part_01
MYKVPYVDPPQLNAIRHAKFRTQKVLFVWYRVGTSGPEIYRIFVPLPKSFGPYSVLLLVVQSVYLRNRDIEFSYRGPT